MSLFNVGHFFQFQMPLLFLFFLTIGFFDFQQEGSLKGYTRERNHATQHSEQTHVITNSRDRKRSFCTFTPHAEAVVHGITRLEINFHIFATQNPSHITMNAESLGESRKMVSECPPDTLKFTSDNQKLAKLIENRIRTQTDNYWI